MILAYSFLVSLNLSLDSIERFVIDNGEDITIGPQQKSFFTYSDLNEVAKTEGIQKAVPRLSFGAEVEGIRINGTVVKLVPSHSIMGLNSTKESFFSSIELVEGSCSLQGNYCMINSYTAKYYGLKVGDTINITDIHVGPRGWNAVKGGYNLVVGGVYRFKDKLAQVVLTSGLTPVNVIIVGLDDAKRISAVDGFNQIIIKLRSENLWISQFYTSLFSKARELEEKFNIGYSVGKYGYTLSLAEHLSLIRIYYSSIAITIIVYIFSIKKLLMKIHYTILTLIAGLILGLIMQLPLTQIMLGLSVPQFIDRTRLSLVTLIPIILAAIIVMYLKTSNLLRKTS